MHRILASQLSLHIDKKVCVQGWLNNIRALGKVNFLILRDRSGFLQVTIQDKAEYAKISSLQPGSILSIEGQVTTSPQSPLGVEIINPKISIQVPITEVCPVEYYKPEMAHDLDFILDHRPLSLRQRSIQAVF